MPAVAAAGFAGVLTLASDELATLRSLTFLGGPLVLLAGLHARLFDFLHAPDRLRSLPLPLAPEAHWAAGRRRHLGPLLLSCVFGAAAVLLARPEHPSLALEFVWLAAISLAVEPAVAGCSALMGRRFDEDSLASEWQRALGGGWTTAEAVVHLYAPAFGVGLAALLAMPGQLAIERWADGVAVSTQMIAAPMVVPAAIALALRAAAPAMYRRGLWEAVPWLAEATRTLAGPPQPEAAPAWIRWIPDPWLRLVVLQFMRTTPLPYVRFALVTGLALWLAIRSAPPTGAAIASSLAATGLWVVPGLAVAQRRWARASLAGALPLSSRRRKGRAGLTATALLWTPPACLALVVALRLAVSGWAPR